MPNITEKQVIECVLAISRETGECTRLVGVNERGNRVGQDHPGAVLTDRDIELMFELREEGWGYRKLCAKFDCSKTLVRKIIHGKVRCQHPARFKQVVEAIAAPPTGEDETE